MLRDRVSADFGVDPPNTLADLTHAALPTPPEQFGVTQPSYHRWEAGANRPDDAHFAAIADYLGLRVNEEWNLVHGPDEGPTSLAAVQAELSALRRDIDALRESMRRIREAQMTERDAAARKPSAKKTPASKTPDTSLRKRR
jgi:hypothetical protein